jgi:hypothetical protein
VGTTAALVFPASPSLIFMTTSLLVFSLANPDEPLSNVTVDEMEMTMRDAPPLGTEQD